MEKINRLILENKAWAESKKDADPEYFTKMARDQNPEYLWIGCSDSRVHPSEITNTHPGEIFVHRNIANLVVHTDMNFMSVLQYAVEYLGVRHIIVCGHYNCGGVKAAIAHKSLGLIDNWIRNIEDTYFSHKVEVDSIKNDSEKVNRLVELNVIEQVKNLSHSAIIQKAWHDKKQPFIHGWIYDLNNGLVKQLITLEPGTHLDSAYRYDF